MAVLINLAEASQSLDNERCIALRTINRLFEHIPTGNLQEMAKHLGWQVEQFQKRQAEAAKKPRRRTRKKPVAEPPA